MLSALPWPFRLRRMQPGVSLPLAGSAFCAAACCATLWSQPMMRPSSHRSSSAKRLQGLACGVRRGDGEAAPSASSSCRESGSNAAELACSARCWAADPPTPPSMLTALPEGAAAAALSFLQGKAGGTVVFKRGRRSAGPRKQAAGRGAMHGCHEH